MIPAMARILRAVKIFFGGADPLLGFKGTVRVLTAQRILSEDHVGGQDPSNGEDPWDDEDL
jgi:hypothetical protein